MSVVVEPGSPESAMLLRWSVLAEAGDSPAAWLVAGLGPCGAWDWAAQAIDDPVSATAVLAPTVPARTIAAAIAAAPRWAARWGESDPAALRERTRACGAQVIARGEPGWPRAFDSLGAAAPFALWSRGPADVGWAFGGGIAVVGARSATSYGEHVTAGIAAEIARGCAPGAVAASGARAVVSGGAYGVDAAAHRATLAAGGTTVAVLAGGIDQVYPAGNTDLLGRVAETGALVAEAPPGRAPYRARFLLRNRLIATAAATVVVEAAVRSGALSTARHAMAIGRPVGAVPGPVTSAVSGGCHELLREGTAVLVRDAQDARELAAPIGDMVSSAGHAGALVAPGDPPRQEFSSPADRAVFDASGGRGGDLDEISRRAGLTAPQALASLGRLELAGLVVKDAGVWRRPEMKRLRPRQS